MHKGRESLDDEEPIMSSSDGSSAITSCLSASEGRTARETMDVDADEDLSVTDLGSSGSSPSARPDAEHSTTDSSAVSTSERSSPPHSAIRQRRTSRRLRKKLVDVDDGPGLEEDDGDGDFDDNDSTVSSGDDDDDGDDKAPTILPPARKRRRVAGRELTDREDGRGTFAAVLFLEFGGVQMNDLYHCMGISAVRERRAMRVRAGGRSVESLAARTRGKAKERSGQDDCETCSGRLALLYVEYVLPLYTSLIGTSTQPKPTQVGRRRLVRLSVKMWVDGSLRGGCHLGIQHFMFDL